MSSRDPSSGSESPDALSSVGGNAAPVLRSFVERIERLAEEKQALSADIREIFAEAKGNGFDVKTLRKVIAIRRLDPAEHAEQESLLELYCRALGIDPLS